MTQKADITVGELASWDQYSGTPVKTALPQMYAHAMETSDKARSWYWKSIAPKRKASYGIRLLSFLLLVCGAVLPIFAGLSSDTETRLTCTQLGVAALAVAGLLQAGDRVFGWSSGWLRYITTATAMETVTRRFELDWASYMLGKADALNDSDKRPLFDLVTKFEDDIAKLQTDETEKWVAEFNSSLATLNDLVRSQRESAEKTVEVARATAAAKETAAVALAKVQQHGGIEVTIVHQGPPTAVTIAVDDGNPVAFTGASWVARHVLPGMHTVRVVTTMPPAHAFERIALVPPGEIAKVEVKL